MVPGRRVRAHHAHDRSGSASARTRRRRTDAIAAFLVAQHGRAAFALSDASWVTILQGCDLRGDRRVRRHLANRRDAMRPAAHRDRIRAASGAGTRGSAGLRRVDRDFAERGLFFAAAVRRRSRRLAFMMVAIAIAESMRRRPTVLRAAGLGVAIALWLTADPIGYVTASAMVVSLIFVGVVDVVRIDHRRLRLRVWWVRRRVLVIVCTVVAIGLWLVLTTAFFHRPLVASVVYYLHAAFAPPLIACPHALHRIVPILRSTNLSSWLSRSSACSRSSRDASAIALRRGRWCGRSSALAMFASVSANHA